jgi:hypothetical protein
MPYTIFIFLWSRINSNTSTWEEWTFCCGLQFNIYIYRQCFINKQRSFAFICRFYILNDLEVKKTTELVTFASYLDDLLNIDAGGKLTTQLYDKRDELILNVNFSYISSNIPLSPANDKYTCTSQLIRYVKGLFHLGPVSG